MTSSSDGAERIISEIESTGRAVALTNAKDGSDAIKVERASGLDARIREQLKIHREAILERLRHRTPYDPYEIDRAVERHERKAGGKISESELRRSAEHLVAKGLRSGTASPSECDAAVQAAIRETWCL